MSLFLAEFHIFMFFLYLQVFAIKWFEKKISAEYIIISNTIKTKHKIMLSEGARHWQTYTTAIKMALTTHAKPTVTSVYLKHPAMVCACKGQNAIAICEILYFWLIFKWMLHIVTLARRWVNFGYYQCSHRLKKFKLFYIFFSKKNHFEFQQIV